MAYCSKCGTSYEEGTKFCPGCGAPVAEKQTTQQNDFSSKFQNLNNTADTTADFDKADVDQNKVMAVLSYLSFLVLIPIFAAKQSKYARFHANQGLVLLLAVVAWNIVSEIVSKIFWAVVPALGVIVSVLLWVASIAFFVLMIIGIVNAANGKAKELPIIGKFRILK